MKKKCYRGSVILTFDYLKINPSFLCSRFCKYLVVAKIEEKFFFDFFDFFESSNVTNRAPIG